jgi:hypothetical protein
LVTTDFVVDETLTLLRLRLGLRAANAWWGPGGSRGFRLQAEVRAGSDLPAEAGSHEIGFVHTHRKLSDHRSRAAGSAERNTGREPRYYRPAKTISLKLPDEIDARLEAPARARGRTKSDLTREALTRFLESDGGSGASCLDLVRDLVGSTSASTAGTDATSFPS